MSYPIRAHSERRTVLLGLLGLSSVSFATSCKTQAKDWSLIRSVAREVVSSRKSPGLSITIVRNGTIEFSSGFGLAELEAETPVTSSTVFKIASITKHFVAVALLMLEEAGALALTDPLSKYVPEVPSSDRITLYNVAAHTAGMGSYSRLPTRPQDQTKDYNFEAFLQLMLRSDPLYVGKAGEVYQYSNTGYGLLGLAVERATGRPYVEILEALIFDPNGMSLTFPGGKEAEIPNLAKGYSNRSEAESGFELATPITPSYVGAAGSVMSTTEDLALWHNRLVVGSALSQAARSKLLAPIMTMTGPTLNCLAGSLQTSAKGLETLSVVSQGGRLNGYSSHVWSFPDSGVTVACLFNTDGGDDDAFGNAFDSVRDPATKLAVGHPL